MRGDREAFRAVLEAVQKLAFNIAWRITWNTTDAEDATQEIFLRLFRNFPQYDSAQPFLPWFRRLATNCALNWMEKKRPASALPEIAVRDGTPLDSSSRLHQAIRELPPEYQACVTLAVAPNVTHRSSTALREHNFKSLLVGTGVTAIFLALLAVVHQVPPLAFLTLVAYGSILIPAYVASSEEIGRRIYSASGKEGSRAVHLAVGWLVFAFGSLFPVIGWFVILPYVTLSGVGSLLVGAKAKTPDA
jgi:RNA polymerase sigma-70 factor (ECF subfamily)